MKNRIKQLRAELGDSQAKFAKSLGVKQTTVANWELGSNVPDSVRNLICHTFRVRREWLENGDGEIFEPEPEPISEAEAQEKIVRECFERLLPEQQEIVLSVLREAVEKSCAPQH
jgi:DNA-binding XRE family transcriptional regulator